MFGDFLCHKSDGVVANKISESQLDHLRFQIVTLNKEGKKKSKVDLIMFCLSQSIQILFQHVINRKKIRHWFLKQGLQNVA